MVNQRDERRRNAAPNERMGARRYAANTSGERENRHRDVGKIQGSTANSRSHSIRATRAKQKTQNGGQAARRAKNTIKPGVKNTASATRRANLESIRRTGAQAQSRSGVSTAQRPKNTPLTSTCAARTEKQNLKTRESGSQNIGNTSLRKNYGRSATARTANLNSSRRQVSTNQPKQNSQQNIGGAGASRLQFDARQKNRLILVLALIALIALIIFAYVYVKGQVADYHQAKATPAEAEQFEPVACTAENMDVSLEISGRSDGPGAVFNVIFTNTKSIAPCYLDAGNSHVQLQVTSGNENVWNSQVCKAGAESKQLLLSKGVSSRQSYLWNGIHAGVSCDGTSLAQAGTYRVSLALDHEVLVDQSPFVINQNGTIGVLSTITPTQESNDENDENTATGTQSNDAAVPETEEN